MNLINTTKPYNLNINFETPVFCRKLLHVHAIVGVVKKPVATRPKKLPFPSHYRLEFLKQQSFKIPRLLSSSLIVKRRSSTIASRTCSIFSDFIVPKSWPECRSLSTDVRPFFNYLYQSFICVSIAFAQLFWGLKQNCMQICCLHLFVIFSNKKVRQTKQTASFSAESLVTLVTHRGRSNVLARNSGRILLGQTSYVSISNKMLY